jgi:hypothetical protein
LSSLTYSPRNVSNGDNRPEASETEVASITSIPAEAPG